MCRGKRADCCSRGCIRCRQLCVCLLVHMEMQLLHLWTQVLTMRQGVHSGEYRIWRFVSSFPGGLGYQCFRGSDAC